MTEESEQACLVNPKSPLNVGMQYTDGIGSVSAIPSSSSSHIHSQQSNTLNNDNKQAQSTTSVPHRVHETSINSYDINDDIILSQFHADAIKQAGCGKFQFLATLIIGLGLAGHVIQVYSVFYILPSAEIEYCILDDELDWISNVTLLGIGCGALLFGALAGKNGRRRTLLSCLAISSVFSVVLAFMPAYGPFMLTKFCAAIGIGGVFSSATAYLCEITPLNSRGRTIAFLCTLGVAGGILAGAVAIQIVPMTGQQIAAESKQHFGAWHRYLIIMALVPITSLIFLSFLPESPRFLLANGHEVEALATYQQIYKTNRSRDGYALTELELPSVRSRRASTPSSVLASMVHNIYACCSTFVQLYNEKYSRTTYLLMATWFASIFVFHGLTVYISEYSKAIETTYYNHNQVTKFNVSFQNMNFVSSLDNMIFDQCNFKNCTFRKLFISHVLFHNSTFKNTEFSNVKTSRTEFRNSTLYNIKFIDTEVTAHNFLDCKINNTKIVRLNGSCDMDFDYNIFILSVWKSNLGGLIPCILAILTVGEAIQRLGRAPVASCCYTIAMILCITLGFVTKDEIVIWIGGCAQGFILAGLTSLTLFTVENYTTIIRCTALGVLVCFSQIGALLGSTLYIHLPMVTTKIAATISTIFMTIPFVSTLILKDPCLLV